MPVTATQIPNVLRASFIESHDKHKNGSETQTEIVCFVRPNHEGIEINYAYHIRRAREISGDPWDERRSRIPLNPALIHVIQSNIMLELWSLFSKSVVNLSDDLKDLL